MKKVWTREELTEIFTKNKRVTVTFQKNDGTTRVMKGTKSLDLIPEKFHPKGVSEPHPINFPVYDLEADGWRSFNMDREVEVVVVEECTCRKCGATFPKPDYPVIVNDVCTACFVKAQETEVRRCDR